MDVIAQILSAVNFWHSFTTTGDKLKVPLGKWINPTHHIWEWYYRTKPNNLQQVYYYISL